ncbi:MAG TPA: leucyl aminopeptidase [Candidatus Eremiobacteraceae bacterium]|nr:leucyl aminopeptidase [Candidatus Eremiobacteraceae bacterium]
MKIHVRAENPLRVAADAVAIPIFSDGEVPDTVKALDKPLGHVVRDMFRGGEIRGREDELHVLPTPRLKAKRVFAVGLGPPANRNAAAMARFAGTAVRAAQRRGVKSLAFVLPELPGVDPSSVGELFAEGAIMATFDPAPYRTKNEAPRTDVATVTLLVPRGADERAIKAGVARGTILGEAANEARVMVNTPANHMTPTHLAQIAKDFGKRLGLKVTVLDEPQMKKLGMGSFLSVAAGSDQPSKVIALEYTGDKSSKTKLGLVGKGITFDTGGISLKPALDMDAMKGDMAGGATVLAALAAIARLKPKVNVVGIVVATENMPSGKATKPGDVVRAMNGKTIEVINTDAEGRLVLADGLVYARKMGATHLVDIATLTGAVVIALGHTSTGVMSNDREFVDTFHRATLPYGERYWELPLFPEYAELIKSPIADMKNSGGRQAGTIFGAMFLKEFVGDTPWIHLDIAGTSWADRDSGALVKGPSAVGLRPLVRLADLLAEHAVHGRADEAAYRRLADGSSGNASAHGGNGKSSGRVRARRRAH